jgi:hypothetical protein
MPKEFDDCQRRGGRIRTKTLKGGKYVHICFDQSGSHAGHVKKKKRDGR